MHKHTVCSPTSVELVDDLRGAQRRKPLFFVELTTVNVSLTCVVVFAPPPIRKSCCFESHVFCATWALVIFWLVQAARTFKPILFSHVFTSQPLPLQYGHTLNGNNTPDPSHDKQRDDHKSAMALHTTRAVPMFSRPLAAAFRRLASAAASARVSCTDAVHCVEKSSVSKLTNHFPSEKRTEYECVTFLHRSLSSAQTTS